MAKKITKWEPDNFELEMTTHWSFPQRGDWATHDAKWRGNWSPYIPRNILLRYSQEGDLVLDQFAGGGTTLVEAKLLNRNIIGVDVNDVALDRCREKTAFEHEGADGKVYIHKGDARHLDFIPERTSDFLFAVFSEEFGFFGDICLLGLYTLLIMRALYIASVANTVFERLLACAIATIFLIYSFVNMGMVSGILPVVGVPLPFMSYGGTALLILGICCGLLMKISAQRRIKVSLYGDDYRS